MVSPAWLLGLNKASARSRRSRDAKCSGGGDDKCQIPDSRCQMPDARRLSNPQGHTFGWLDLIEQSIQHLSQSVSGAVTIFASGRSYGPLEPQITESPDNSQYQVCENIFDGTICQAEPPDKELELELESERKLDPIVAKRPGRVRR